MLGYACISRGLFSNVKERGCWLPTAEICFMLGLAYYLPVMFNCLLLVNILKFTFKGWGGQDRADSKH